MHLQYSPGLLQHFESESLESSAKQPFFWNIQLIVNRVVLVNRKPRTTAIAHLVMTGIFWHETRPLTEREIL